MSRLAYVEDALRAHGCKGGRGLWTCPAHEDRSPSLSVNEGDDGRVLINCFAGCEAAAVVEAIGLNLRDLFDGRPPEGWTPPPLRPTGLAWSPAAPIAGRIGLPTWDDVFWSQADDDIDMHFAQLLRDEEARLADEARRAESRDRVRAWAEQHARRIVA